MMVGTHASKKKLLVCFLVVVSMVYSINGLVLRSPLQRFSRNLNLKMVSTDKKLADDKKLPKVEGIKLRSNYLTDPLKGELDNDQIFVSPDAVVVLKYHGSYMQDNRDKRTRGAEKEYSFMLRLKAPCGEIPSTLYKHLDEMADKFGQGDLRITTRQAYQLHGILKGNLKTVISTLIEVGSSTIGACGDVSRNVMCSPAPFVSKEYQYARQYAKVFADLFKPQSPALTELWMGAGEEKEKVAGVEYWSKDVQDAGIDIQSALMKDTGNGVLTKDPVEPLYGNRYLPRKFKMAVTVEGDNSLDLYINDIGLVTIMNDKDELEGFNVVVGGGMGRTHMKETTFPRAADHLGFVKKDDVMELCKCILAAQRDHGNRDVRLNARMKYLVHERGIDGFRSLVETYFGKPIEPFRPMKEWKYVDWMGWHEQGDGKWFLGINIVQGRVKDSDGVNLKSALKAINDELALTTILSPSQSLIFKDVKPEQKDRLVQILTQHGVPTIENVDSLVRKSIACPALPLCGLAVTEAERRMPEFVSNTRNLLNNLNLHNEEIMMRMTGCPNGCARPYMAELALVGDGPDMYQVWIGGSPHLTRVGLTYKDKVKYGSKGEMMDAALEPLFVMWRDQRRDGEAFGDFAHRVGMQAMSDFADKYAVSQV